MVTWELQRETEETKGYIRIVYSIVSDSLVSLIYGRGLMVVPQGARGSSTHVIPRDAKLPINLPPAKLL